MISIIVSAGLLMGVLSLWLGGMVPPSPSAVNLMIRATLTPIAPPLGPSTPVTGTVKISEIDGAEMVYVPAGEFIMGSSDSDSMASNDEKPQHTVYLDAFWIDKYEATNAQYRKCVEAGACAPPHDTRYYDYPAYADHPVVYVDWPQAKAYCHWAGGGCQPKPNGRRRRGGQMGASGPGETSGMRTKRTPRRPGPATRRRWAATPREPAPTEPWIWLGTSGSGWPTGTMRAVTPDPLPGIPKGPTGALTRCCAAVPGMPTRDTPVALIVTAATASGMTAGAFAVPSSRSPEWHSGGNEVKFILGRIIDDAE